MGAWPPQVAGVSASERRVAMETILAEALGSAHHDLGAAAPSPSDSAPSRPEADDRTLALLERYSELLVHMTRGKLAGVPGSM